MTIFLPGLQIHPALGVGQGQLNGAVPLVDGGEAIQGFDHSAGEVLATEEQPFLERGSVGQSKAFEEQATYQADGLLHPSVVGGSGVNRSSKAGASSQWSLWPLKWIVWRVLCRKGGEAAP